MQSITKMPPEEDPAPIAPIRPDDGDCCQSGCQRCVFDLYDDAVERYRAELAAWEARRANRTKMRRRTSGP